MHSFGNNTSAYFSNTVNRLQVRKGINEAIKSRNDINHSRIHSERKERKKNQKV